jgi:CheY-like chemotaxis protein
MAGNQACVLVVDDEPSICETLCELVEMTGCSAIVASNGAEALRVLERRRPCLIILDIMMPVMSGSEMLEVMRRRADLADLPVLVSTSAPDRAPRGVPVVPKPIDIDVVWGWIRRTCQCGGAGHDA